MSTALSWTELRSSRLDLAALLHFRRSGLSATARRRLRIGSLVIVLLTVAAAVLPAYLGGPQPRDKSGSILAVFPSMCLGFLLLSCISAVASAGGREVIPREQAVAFPVSSMTDHLGALLLAPLNIAWLVQTWALLGFAGYVFGPTRLAAYELPVLLWVVSATALAQVVGWCAEGVRRGRHGIAGFRVLVVVLVGRDRHPGGHRPDGAAARPQPHPLHHQRARRRADRALDAVARRHRLPGRGRPRRGGRRRRARSLGAGPAHARGAPARVRPPPGAPPAPLGPRDDAAHRPHRDLAVGPPASRPDRAGPDARCGRPGRPPGVADADGAAGSGGLRRLPCCSA